MRQEKKNEFEVCGGAQCPFWKHQHQLTMYCEGAKIPFPDKESRLRYKQRYCCNADGGYKECTIYKMLMQFYDKKYEGGDSQ